MALRIEPNNLPAALTRGTGSGTAPQVNAQDLRQFAALRRGAEANDPNALRAAARQFESLFTKMMLDSMRKASFGDPLFGSDQGDMYQDMMDDQMSVQLSQGRGLGLADMLIRQLSHGEVAPAATNTNPDAAAKYNTVSPADRQKFVDELLPHATAAARELGVDPRSIIAQAALETGWGTAQPGGTSNNLFGIKAGASWQGASVASGTHEYESGVAGAVVDRFRAYESPRQSVEDYVQLLRDQPRYAAALNTGTDVHAFAAALQRGGYASDPDYAHKLVAVAEQLGLHDTPAQFKSPASGPIPAQEPSRMSNG